MSSEKFTPAFPKVVTKTEEEQQNILQNNISAFPRIKQQEEPSITDYDYVPGEENSDVSSVGAALAGVFSGLIKIPEGFVSLGAELVDLGLDTNYAARIENFFDDINPFEEYAEKRAIGRITQGLTQIGFPAVAGAKIATKLATKALQAKRAGNYVNLKTVNVAKGLQKTRQLNQLSKSQRFTAVTLGGAAGETFVADVEELGTLADSFGAGPTQLDLEEKEGKEDAARKLMNRVKFGTESIFVTPFVYGAGYVGKALVKRGRDLLYSSSKIDRTIAKAASIFTPRGLRPKEQFLAKEAQKARELKDVNFAKEQTARIDREINKIFPQVKSIYGENRKKLLKDLDELLFTGDLNEGLNPNLSKTIAKTMSSAGASQESIGTVFTALTKTRDYFKELLDITAGGPGAKVDLPEGISVDLRKIMGQRVKNFIGNTYEIFDNREAGLLSQYKPTKESVQKTKELFIRYAKKNGVELTDEGAEKMVNDIIKQVEGRSPSSDILKGPFFSYADLTQGAQSPYTIKTFKRILTNDLPNGEKDIQVIGKGSKIFRDLFGETTDARHSIFEGVNRLSLIARKNQLFDEILDADQALKAAADTTTPVGRKGFFFSSPLDAQNAFGPNADIVPLDDYLGSYFKNGILVNRLKNTFTTKEIAEGFTNVSKLQDFLRGESGGFLGQSFSWAWRNLLLTPKAGAQYAKTILSVPTHIRNFLSSGAFSAANGVLFEDPRLVMQAMAKAGATVQVGIRQPLSMERYRRYLELGVTNTNVRYGDLKNLMKDVRIGENNFAVDGVLKRMVNSLGRAGKVIKKTGETMQDLYVAEDDFWKITNFEVEVARRGRLYEKAGITKSIDELEREAAEIIKDTIPNYSRVGEFVRSMRASPFGTFMSWPSEVFRTGTGIFEQAIKDINNPVMKEIGYKRLFGMLGTATLLPYAAIKGSQAIFGVSDEQADAANDFVEPWAESGQKIYVRKPGDPNLYYINYSQNNVYDTLTRPFQTVLREVQKGITNKEQLVPSFIRGVAKAAGEVASPFVAESIYTEAFLDIFAREGRTREGTQLYTEKTPLPEKVEIIIKHLGKTLMPTTGAFERTYKALTGEPGKGPTIYEIPDEMAGIFGWRLNKIEPKKALGFYIYDFQRGQSEARRLFTGGPEGTLSGEIKTPRDVVERFFIANKQLFEVQREMLGYLNSAKKLGISDSDLMELFDQRGISDKIPGMLMEGAFKPFVPSENIRRRFETIAQESRKANPFEEAAPIIGQIIDAFANQSLYKPNTLKLEDFLPIPGSEQSSVQPLPQQPMPSPGVVNSKPQQVSNATGLTPTENALLSEEEKQIRLRQRGLV